MVLSKISTFGFDFGIWPGAKSFLVFGLRLRPNVKMHLWSFTVSQNKSIAYFSPKYLDKPLILAVSCISPKTFLLKKNYVLSGCTGCTGCTFHKVIYVYLCIYAVRNIHNFPPFQNSMYTGSPLLTRFSSNVVF